jgi:CHASE2 domain-containing sensor protein
MLHNNDRKDFTLWDSLEECHAKFRFGKQGFSNITITDDSVILRELPMRQYFRENIEFSFSYSVALQYGLDHIHPRYTSSFEDFVFDEDIFEYSFKVISVKDLLAEKFDKKDLTDQIVLMGAVTDKEYSYYIDDSKTKRISGIEFQAYLVREILK